MCCTKFPKRLVADTSDSQYSLLLDESTDVRVSNYLGIVIRYFSEDMGNVVATYLGFLELELGDVGSIARAVLALLGIVEEGREERRMT